jgi:hypothetical protein
MYAAATSRYSVTQKVDFLRNRHFSDLTGATKLAMGRLRVGAKAG